jgi:hypothetical protein
MKINTLMLVIVLLNNLIYLGQINDVEKPVFNSPNIVRSFQSYQVTKSNINSSFQNANIPQPMLGMTAKDVIANNNRQTMQRMGYKPPPTEADIQAELRAKRNYAYQLQQQNTIQAQTRKAVYDALKEDHKTNRQSNTTARYNGDFLFADHNSERYKNNIEYFESAFNKINSMLNGEDALSIKEAVYLIEDVINKGKMSRTNYNNRIDNLKEFARERAKEYNVNLNDNLKKHFAIQRLYSDTALNALKYDFNDPLGRNDYRQIFVTKLLETGMGQCRSLPLMYLILAEEMGVDAYLSFAPEHSYIQFEHKGHLYNFETTNGFIGSKNYIVGSGFVKVESIKTKAYMYPLNKKQTIAHLLLTLARMYRHEIGYDSFLEKCVNTSLKHYPGIHGAMEKANVETAKLDLTLWQHGYPTMKQVEQSPQLSEQFDRLMGWYQIIDDMGYTEISTGAYEAWIESLNSEQFINADQTIKVNLKKID